jgi:hypothetical protein
MAQVAEPLPSKGETLNSNPVPSHTHRHTHTHEFKWKSKGNISKSINCYKNLSCITISSIGIMVIQVFFI